jgi:hypothetical protein
MFDCNLIQVVTKACLTVEVTPAISPQNKSDTVEHALVTTCIKLQSNML